MPFSVRDVRKALTAKLAFEEDESRRHPTFFLRQAGVVIAVTHISHGPAGGDVSDGIISAMARQLGVRGPELRGAITCTVSPEGFVGLILKATA